MAHLSAELEIFRDMCNLIPLIAEEKANIMRRIEEIKHIEYGVSSPKIYKVSPMVSRPEPLMTEFYCEKETLWAEINYYEKAEEWVRQVLMNVDESFRDLAEEIYIYKYTSFEKSAKYYGYVPNYLRDLVTTQIRKAVQKTPPPLQVREIVAANVDRLYKRRIKHPPEE